LYSQSDFVIWACQWHPASGEEFSAGFFYFELGGSYVFVLTVKYATLLVRRTGTLKDWYFVSCSFLCGELFRQGCLLQSMWTRVDD
jgi:hypothetical protein